MNTITKLQPLSFYKLLALTLIVGVTSSLLSFPSPALAQHAVTNPTVDNKIESLRLTKEQVSTRIDELMVDGVLPPKEIINELATLSEYSRSNNWQRNELLANILMSEMYVYLEDYPKANKLLKRYFPLAKSLENKRDTLRLELVELSIESAKGRSQRTEDIIAELTNYANNGAIERDVAAINMGIGQSLYMFQDYENALVQFQSAYKIYSKQGDKAFIGFALTSLSNISTDLEDYETAIKYLNESIEINKELNDEFNTSIVIYNLGQAYIAKKDYQLALTTLEESLVLSIKLEDDIGVAWAKQSIAEVYSKLNQPIKAIKLYQDVAPIFEKNGDNGMLFTMYIEQVRCYLELQDPINTKALLDKAQPLLSKINNTSYTATYNKLLAKLHFLQKDYQNAYLSLNEFSQLREMVNQETNEKQATKLRIQFDSQLNENKNKVLAKENELKALQILQQQKENDFWLIVAILSVLLLVVITYALFKQINYKNKFAQLALHDHLTDSPNRRYILSIAERMINNSKERDFNVSIGIIDLDHFKNINDTYGHDTGDKVLKAFASACKTALRKEDCFGRYGGEEWLLLLKNDSPEEIEAICQRIHSTLNQDEVDGYPQGEKIEFSVGVASTEDSQNLKTLINRADENLYKAKENGRNQIVFEKRNYHFAS